MTLPSWQVARGVLGPGGMGSSNEVGISLVDWKLVAVPVFRLSPKDLVGEVAGKLIIGGVLATIGNTLAWLGVKLSVSTVPLDVVVSLPCKRL